MKYEQKVFMHVRVETIDNEEPNYLALGRDDTDKTWLCLGEVTLIGEIPPIPSREDITNKQVNFLRQGREKVVEEFTQKLANIDQQIEELLALPAPEA